MTGHQSFYLHTTFTGLKVLYRTSNIQVPKVDWQIICSKGKLIKSALLTFLCAELYWLSLKWGEHQVSLVFDKQRCCGCLFQALWSSRLWAPCIWKAIWTCREEDVPVLQWCFIGNSLPWDSTPWVESYQGVLITLGVVLGNQVPGVR